MARGLNKVMLIGNVGSDPEIRMTPSGTKVAKVGLATNRTWKNSQGNERERTEWHQLNFWGRLADVVEQWVHKGDRLYVEGRVEYDQSQDQNGVTRFWTNIQVQELVMLGSSNGGSGGGGMSNPRGQDQAGGYGYGGVPEPPISEPDDDLPF